MVMDRGKLRQVLLNLAENARHAMSEGGTLTLGLTHDPNGPLRFTVRDTGCGIPRDSLKNIFDAFFSTKDDGNGLGLSIVRQIVESSGGTISVQSEIDRGTCFTVCFPPTTKAQRRGLQAARPATPSEVTA
jgi:signal transduction histidine kinase